MGDIRFTVRQLIAQGRVVLPVKPGEKATRFPKWQKAKATEQDFGPEDNVAERLDAVVDIDCDCAETRALAPRFLPETGRIHGRPSLGASHFWYRVADATKSRQFKDTTGEVLIEIRFDNNHYTLIPPSVVMTKGENPQPEALLYFAEGDPGITDNASLFERVRVTATAALLARHWPKGSRHHCAAHVAGFLAAREMRADDIVAIVRAAATQAHDEEVDDRVRAAEDSVSTFKSGGKTTGGPGIAEVMGKDVLGVLTDWYGGNDSKFDQLVAEMNERRFGTRMGSKYVYVLETDHGIIPQNSRDLFEEFINQKVRVGTAKKKQKEKQDDGSEVTTEVDEPKFKTKFEIWRESPKRRTYRTIVFAPPPATADNQDYNLWKGFAVDPMVPADPAARKDIATLREWADQEARPRCQLFLDLMRDGICDGNLVHFDYLSALCALTVQFPGLPSEVAAVLKGEQGAGKGTFVRTFGALFGRHFAHLDRTEQLAGKFNAALSARVVVFADEAFFAGDKRDLGALKRLITEPTIAIERKGFDIVEEPNYMHLFMATNEDFAHQAGMNERRFFTVKVSDKFLQDRKFFGEMRKQMKDEGGLQALLSWFLTREVTHDFVRAVPRTKELRAQQDMSLSAELKWWVECLNHGFIGPSPDEGWPEYTTSDQLHASYIGWCDVMKINRRVGSIDLVRRHLHEFLVEGRVRRDEKWVRRLKTLAECREVLDSMLGTQEQWEEDETPGLPNVERKDLPF